MSSTTTDLISKLKTPPPLVPLSSRTNMSTKDSGRMMNEQAEEYNSGKMAPYTKDIGKTTSPMVTVDSSMLTAMYISASGSTIEPQVKVQFLSYRNILFCLWSQV